MTIIPLPERVWVTDPLTLRMLDAYRRASLRRKVAFRKLVERVAKREMSTDEATRLFHLEADGLSGSAMAALRRQSLKTVEGSAS